MKIILAAATSIDGKLTRGDDPDVRQWTSDEDAAHFAQLKAAHNLLVMGLGTYEAMRSKLKLSANILRVVLTHHPQDFAGEAVARQLEFSSESPAKLVERLANQGYSEILLVGGGQVHAEFLAAGLVDEIYLTIEPLVFGTGTDFAHGAELNIDLELVSSKQLNDRGTLLLHYKVWDNKS